MKFITESSEETKALASLLAQHIQLGTVIILEGPLGSGKTTFTQGLGKALGIERAIKSPTYTIVKDYPLEEGEFVHIDAYRLEEGGAEAIDLPMFIRHDTIVLIEWAKYVEAFLPENYLKLSFEPTEDLNKRTISVDISQPNSFYQTLIEHWQSHWKGSFRDE